MAWAARVLAAALSLVVSACAETGDLGRPTAGVWNSLVLPAVGRTAAKERGEPASTGPLTDLERELRDRSWRFLMPGQDRAFLDRVMANLARTRILPASDHPADPHAYYESLVAGRFASPASRFRTISDDAAADLHLIGPFGAVAARVIAADRARLRSLAYVRELSGEQIAEASARVIENRCLIAWVRAEIRERVEAYRYALEHAFIAMPQDEAGETERTVHALERHRHALDTLPVPPWRDGECLTAQVDPAPPTVRRVAKPLVVKD